MGASYQQKSIHIVYYIASLGLGVAIGLIVYNTVIVPEPYRKDLVRCIETAEMQGDEIAKAACFGTYSRIN